ncbi:MAG TPA: M1 family metallopeptidase [Acidimicrobiales bacterium]|nr:M1 family metallopeptidase [Acidimicrobiales bacterium]
MSTTTNPYRLARTVVPSAYRIFLTPDLDAATFAGRVEIDIDITQVTRSITMHAKELVLGTATLTVAGTSYRSGAASADAAYETATFAFDDDLAPGPATLEISFTGVLNDQLVGFYRSTFTDSEGVTHAIATTQFEHSDARQAFPCWDEPSFKATYQVNLTVPSHLAAYSNSPVIADVDLGNGLRTVSYAPTMKMSTYLVAFVVGPFEETEAVDVLGTPLRVIVPVGKTHLATLALEAGEFALKFFSDYFNIAYPGDKLDMIAIPDFAFGAMENLGCITYRETALLVDPGAASIAEMQRVATVVAHEIAHMWFGDLVTMEWWEGIWLNEAFATFMEVLCTNALRPEWKMWVGFGVDRDAALQIDGLHSTRPIEYEVISPDDTRGMFDLLTYEKGGSVLRMLEQYLGANVFRDGIRNYLTKHSYANTITTDLWDALEETSGHPVRDLMNTWILQGGHPLVTLENGQIRQQPFAYGPARGLSAIGSSWLVPVLTRSLAGGEPHRHLLGDEPVMITDAPPVVLNAGGSGVFRSRYGAAELASIGSHIGELEELERATLLADAWALLFSGQITWNDFLASARGLGQQNEPTPWTTVATAVDFAYRALREDQRPTLVAQVRELFAPQFERLGWDEREGEGELTPQLRAIVLSSLGIIGANDTIRAEAARRFDANELEGDLARAILRIVADQNRPGDYETFLERYRAATSPQEEQRYLWGLAEFNDEKIALDAAARSFSEFRTQDGAIELGLLSRNRVTGPEVWSFMSARWDEALERFSPSTHVRLAMGVPTFLDDDAFADRVESFHLEHPLGGEQRTVLQQIERMRVGISFRDAMRAQF